MSKLAFGTKLFIWIAFGVIVVLDLYWASNGVAGDTISEVTKAYSWQWQTIPVAYGVLTGHLFWGHHGPVALRWVRYLGICVLVATLVTLDVVDWLDVIPIFPVLIGIPLGRLLWPQEIKAGSWLVWKR